MDRVTAGLKIERRRASEDQHKPQPLRRLRHREDCRRASAINHLHRAFEREGFIRSYRRNSRVYSEGERADVAYKIITGGVRAYRLLANGKRQIVAFYLPGDVFGLETGNKHTQFAESIASSMVLVVKRKLILELAGRDHIVANELRDIAWSDLRRSQDHVVLLLFKSAQGRVASFLLDIAHRVRDMGSVELPMWRHDIADYLGLTIETVSRTLMIFQRASAISIPASRQIEIRNRALLRRISR